MLRVFTGLAIVGALLAALVLAGITLFVFFVLAGMVAAISSLVGRRRHPPGPVTIEGESRRVE